MDVEQRTEPACSSLSPQVRMVSETATTVRIATFAYEVRPRPHQTMCAYVTESSRSLLAARSLRLHEPLQDRALVDARTGRRFAVLDAAYVPTPAYVPNGYRQTWVSHYTPRDDFLALRQFGKGTASLEIRVSSEVNWSPTGRLLGHARVEGATARVSDQSYQRCVSWFLRAGVVAEVCSLAENQRFLGVGELLRVARGVV